MCVTCGCGIDEENGVKILTVDQGKMVEDQDHHHDHHHHEHHDHNHDHHHHDHKDVKLIQLEEDILQKNKLMAERNRGYLEAKNILALNLVSSPGSGKTTLLEKTLQDLKNELKFYVIEGDQQTTRDAERIAKTGVEVLQINTGKVCHLDADMIQQSLKNLKPVDDSVLFIENVGNLVCPAMFDLGESARVVVMSVTEGDDKPIKYPNMFQSAQLCLINKIDLLPYVHFDVQQAKEYALRVNHHLKFIELSATTGQGMEEWYGWLKQKR